MECQRCGRPLEPEDRFCSGCGAQAPRFPGEPTNTVIDPLDTGPIPLVEGMAGLEPGMCVIVVQRGPQVGQRFELSGDRLSAGRSPNSDIMLDDVTVSRDHAEFVHTDQGWVLVDLGSLNGTYVNRDTVSRRVLASGDLIQIGKFRLQYLQPEGDARP